MNTNMHRVVAIDLGTTYSATATNNSYKDVTEIINNPDDPEKGNTTPSVVSCSPVDRKAIVGQAAKRNIAIAPQDTIIEIKREMGEVFTEELLEKYGARGIFNIGDPVKVQFMGEWMLPQEISAFILMKMKEVAEKGIGTEIRDAVITVPAYFKEPQRRATEEAALLAGLYPRQLIPEPTAAAICFGVDREAQERRVYLVYDLGGGTFDVSIIEVEGDNINVIATSGDPRLGGGDFDDAIVEWAIELLAVPPYNLDLRNDRLAQARIKYKAEQAKILLSTVEEVQLDLNELNPQFPPVLKLTRQEFENRIKDILRKSLTFVNEAIASAEKKGIERDNVDAILLVGGSSQIPCVKDLLMDHFGRDESFLRGDIDPASVVARGAAIVAKNYQPSPPPFNIASRAQIMQMGPTIDSETVVGFITEHSLSIGIQDDLVSRIVEQGTSIPVKVTKGGFTNMGPTTDVVVQIYQGEGKFYYENTQIGVMHLAQTGAPLEPKPQGFHKFEVTFSLDVNGLLSVTVHHINTGNRYHAEFSHQTGVGGDRALMAMHNRLLGMYSRTAAVVPAPGQPGPSQPIPYGQPQSNPAIPSPPPGYPHSGTQVPPPGYGYSTATTLMPGAPMPTGQTYVQNTAPSPPPGYVQPVPPNGVPTQGHIPPGQVPQTPHAAQGYTQPSQVPPGGPAPVSPVPIPTGEQPGSIQPAVTPGQPGISSAADAGEGVLKPTAEVPAQFKSIVRRANKLLLRQPAPDVLQKFNAFVSALNAGRSEEELEPLGDALEDAYHDTR